MGGKNKQKTGLLLACWILLALVLVIFYVVNRDKIHNNYDHYFGDGTEKEITAAETEKQKKPESNNKLDIELIPGPAETESVTDTIEVNNKTDSSVQVIEVDKQIAQKEEEKNNKPSDQPKPNETVKKENNTPKTKVKLCFVNVDSDGKVIRKVVSRDIDKSNAPLTNTIKTLLDGPSSADKNCMSLIPQGTKLLGASVKNGIATLNFSDEFEFNGINADSYRAQLMQVVYTATEFSTVESVQFLIEGQRKDYMGSEDFQIWIGSPYSRNNF